MKKLRFFLTSLMVITLIFVILYSKASAESKPHFIEQVFKRAKTSEGFYCEPTVWGTGKYHGKLFHWYSRPPCGDDINRVFLSVELTEVENAILKNAEREKEMMCCWFPHVYNDKFKKHLQDSGFVRSKTLTEMAEEFATFMNALDFFSDVTLTWSIDQKIDKCLRPHSQAMEKREVNHDVVLEHCLKPGVYVHSKGSRSLVIKKALKKIFKPMTKMIGWGSGKVDSKKIYWYLVEDQLANGVWIVLAGVHKKPTVLKDVYMTTEEEGYTKILIFRGLGIGYYTTEVKYLFKTDMEIQDLAQKIATQLGQLGIQEAKIFEKSQTGL